MREDNAPRGILHSSSTQRERYMQHSNDGHSNRKRPLHNSLPVKREESYRIPLPRNSRPDYRSKSSSDYQSHSFEQNRSHSSGRPRGPNGHFHGNGNRGPSHSQDMYRNSSHNYRTDSMPRSQRELPHYRNFVNSNQRGSSRDESRTNQGMYHDNARVQKKEISNDARKRFIKRQAGRENKEDTQNTAEFVATEVKVNDQKQDFENAQKASSMLNTETKSAPDRLIARKDEKKHKPAIQEANKTSMDKKEERKPKGKLTTADKISGWFNRAPRKPMKKRKHIPDSSELSGYNTSEMKNGVTKKDVSPGSGVRIAKKQRISTGEIEGGKGGLGKEEKATISKKDVYQNTKSKVSSEHRAKTINEKRIIAKQLSKKKEPKSVLNAKNSQSDKIHEYPQTDGGHGCKNNADNSNGSQVQRKTQSSRKLAKQNLKQPYKTIKVAKKSQKQPLKGKMINQKTELDDQYLSNPRNHSSKIQIETTKVLEDRKLSPFIVSDYTSTTLDATESSFESLKCDNSVLQAWRDTKESRKSSEKSVHSLTATILEVPEQKECDQSDSNSSSDDSDTDEEEILRWGEKMFGVTPPALLQKRLQVIESSEEDSDDDDVDGTYNEEKGNDAGQETQFRRDPLTKPKKKKRKVEVETQEERKRKKEEAKPLTAAQIRFILKDDDLAMPSSHWVRRSSRQPSKDALKTVGVRSLLHKLATNDPDMVVLKMKKYINDPDTPQVVIDGALDALEENTNCQALYIQNFNKGMRDEQVIHLLKILQLPTCKIWCLNIGETYNVKSRTWKKFAKGLKRTKITHMYASEHTIESEYKDRIRETIRANRSKHDMHKNAENLDVIIQCTHCWWNPINTKSLRPFIRKKGYEYMLFDKEGQGLRGSSSGAPGSAVKENPEIETT